jgi:hypothetical protein
MKYGSIHLAVPRNVAMLARFPFVLSAARSAVYRRVEWKTFAANGIFTELL